jgi:hypothetical protein
MNQLAWETPNNFECSECGRKELGSLENNLPAGWRRGVEKIEGGNDRLLLACCEKCMLSLNLRKHDTGRAEPLHSTITIIVNGREKEVQRGFISYEDVVLLAFGKDDGRNFSMTYRHAPGLKTEGILARGEKVGITPKTTFNVADTGSA